MRYKKVLLVSPVFAKGRNRLALLPHVGLGYVANALNNAGVDVSVLDMNLGYNFRDLCSRINKLKPELIGFTAMTLGCKFLYNMINQIKRLYPELKIMLGGSHISALREKVLRDCPGIDYGIMLEGDISVVRLCSGEDLDKIQGFIYRNNAQIITNDFKDFIADLDNLPFPKYESFELEKYPTRQLGIATSRGCPYDCIYCSVTATIGKRFRVRSAQSVADEIAYWHKKGYREIFILDDNFTLLRERVEKICSLLIEKNLAGLHLKCPNGIRADKVDRELLKLMKRAGFDFISFGVEAGNNRILNNLKKGTAIEIIEKAIKDACETGFDVDLFFLIGSPGETREDVKMSFDLAQRYPLRRAIFYNLIPLPETNLLKWLLENNYLTESLDDIFDNASYYLNKPCFFTPDMSVRERKALLQEGKRVTLKIRRKYIESKISGAPFLKRVFSYAYTLPVLDDALVNNRFIVAVKERLKRKVFN